MANLKVTLVPQLSDNYVFLLECQQTGEVAVVDCPDAEPMIALLDEKQLTPSKILNTHHHWDHVGGNEALKQRWPELEIYGFAGDKERITGITHTLDEGDAVTVGASKATVLKTFGHTVGHISYHFADDAMVFCGDSMFVVGCGRLFEGTAAQMHEGLQKLGAMPAETLVYCAHEYTASNIRFALSVDPDNEALKQLQQEVEALRANGEPTVPTTIGREWETNPFLRVDAAAIRAAAERAGADASDPAAVVGAIRGLKDEF